MFFLFLYRYADADVLVVFIQNDGLQPLRLVFEKVCLNIIGFRG
jgi:hypothetical protein